MDQILPNGTIDLLPSFLLFNNISLTLQGIPNDISYLQTFTIRFSANDSYSLESTTFNLTIYDNKPYVNEKI